MYYNCVAFNQNLNGWDVTNVDNAAQIFYNASASPTPILCFVVGT